MSRPICISNGSLMVGLNESGLVNDFYYPYVGLENHASARDIHHRIGIWIDGDFLWLEQDAWDITMSYEVDAMVGTTKAVCSSRAVELEIKDFVAADRNVYCRRIRILNKADTEREVRLFMHQGFRISDSQRDDTALYLPNEHAIMHYKGRRVFLVTGEHGEDKSFDQYSIGLNGIEGHEGTYRDAEDGELQSLAVEHGRVDSTVRFLMKIPALSNYDVRYWISASASQDTASQELKRFKNGGFEKLEESTRSHWQLWLAKSANATHQIDPHYRQRFHQSLFIMKSHFDRRGAVIASGDSEMLNYERDYYSYCWPRDAAFAIWPFLRLGYFEEVEAYFEFARDVLHPGGYLMHKYQPDRAIGSSWHPYINNGRDELPIQEDETAITIFLLGEYAKTGQNDDFIRNLYETLVQPAANFMADFIDSDTRLPHASYDLWEEKFLTSTYTTAVVYAGLLSAASLADKYEFPDDAIRWRTVADDIRQAAHDTLFNKDKNFFYKGFVLGSNSMMEYDETIDSSSFYGAVMFGLFDTKDELVKQAEQTLRSTLFNKSAAGGLPRYEYDNYRRTSDESLGNPWFVTSLWFAQYLIETGRASEAEDIIEWTISCMLDSGALPEQIHPDTKEHLSVEPLVWSQAEFINALLDLAHA